MSADSQVERKPPSEGWLPVDLRVRPDGIRIEWLRFGTAGLTDPFFYQTVDRLRAAPGAEPALATGAEALLELADALPEVSLRGVIFHVSRCGSTLVGNALRSGAVVVSEAPTMNTLFWPQRLQPMPEELRWKLLRALARVYGAHQAHGSGLVIKFSSWNILSWRLILQIWPDVPCVFIVRDPVEVIVSNLQREPQWMRWRANHGIVAREVFGWADVPVNAEEYCARAIGRYCEEGLLLADSGAQVLDYSQLNADAVKRIAEAFRIPADPQAWEGVFRVHAKDPSAKREYTSDIRAKQSAATDAVRNAAETWVERAYSELIKLGSVPVPNYLHPA